MDASQTAEIKQILQEQLRNLCPDEILPKESGPNETADDNDRASREEERSFELHLAARKIAQVVSIREALRGLEAGTFGVCESCEEPIGFRRLLVNPTSILCVQCKSEEEANGSQSLSNEDASLKKETEEETR